MHNICLIYEIKRDYTKALEYYERSLDIKTKIKWNNSMNVATTLNNIDLACSNKGDYAKFLQYIKMSKYIIVII